MSVEFYHPTGRIISTNFQYIFNFHHSLINSNISCSYLINSSLIVPYYYYIHACRHTSVCTKSTICIWLLCESRNFSIQIPQMILSLQNFALKWTHFFHFHCLLYDFFTHSMLRNAIIVINWCRFYFAILKNVWRSQSGRLISD